MTSEPIRDPRADNLLTPQNCALIIIDYQPTQVTSIRSMDQDVLVDRYVCSQTPGRWRPGRDH
jgi:hypothetical protein